MAQAPRRGGLLSSIPGVIRSAGERAGGILSGIGPATTGLRQRAAGSGLLNGLVAAANAAIESEAYTAARDDREKRIKEAKQRDLDMGAARARLGGWMGGGVVPVLGQPGAPMTMPGAPTAGAPAPMGAGPQPMPQPVRQEIDPTTGQTVDVVTVQGGAVRRPGPPPPPFVPNWRAEVQFRAERGDFVGAARVAQEGQKLERELADSDRELALEGSARAGAFLAPLIRGLATVGTDQASVRAAEASIDNAILAARSAGIEVPAALENVLTDTGIPIQERVRFVQGLAGAADPEAVARQSAEFAFAPFENVDLQDRAGGYDPRTNTFTEGPVYGVPAERVFQEQQANQRNAADNATRIAVQREQSASAARVAAINADVRLTVAEKQAAIARERNASAERIAVITGRTVGNNEALGAYVEPEF